MTTTISSNTVIMQTDFDGYTWPVTIAAGLTVTFGENLSVTNTNQYFIVDGSGVTIDGSGNTVDVNNVTNFEGLVKQDNVEISNVTIQNLGVTTSNGTTLGFYGSWVVRSGARNCTVNNCYSTGNMDQLRNGGIFGHSAHYCIANKCYYTGTISLSSSNYWRVAGIFADSNSNCTANSCYVIGDITMNDGGAFFADGNSNCTANNCYYIGNISGNDNTSAFANCTVNNCYASTEWSDSAANSAGLSKIYNGELAYWDISSGLTVPWPLAWQVTESITESITLSENTTITQGLLNFTGIWPVHIAAGLTVTFSENLVIDSSNQYFIVDGSGVTIDGLVHTVDVSGVTNFLGLVKQTDVGISSTTVQNIGVTASNGTTLYDNDDYISGSWLIQSQARYCTVNNCYSTGDIANTFGGGIMGVRSHNCTVNNCYSTGAITGQKAGGICAYINDSSANNCYSTGAISGERAGGIFGYDTYKSFANSCYSTGAISGQYAAGIFSRPTHYTANNCYSTGVITGVFSGGIVASGSGDSNISNCYIANGTWSDSDAAIAGLSKIYNGQLAYWDISAGLTVPWPLAWQVTESITLSENTTINQGWLTFTSIWPVHIAAGLTVTFGENLVIDSSNQYFIVDGSGVTIDGSNHTVDVSGVTNFMGLVKQDNADISNVTIQNIGVTTSNGTTIDTYQGWVVRSGARNCTVINCYSTGNMTYSAGGIFGSSCNTCTATNCYSTGNMTQDDAGGIFGYGCNTCTALFCYSTSNIETASSGIFSNNADTCIANNCYFTGTITTIGGGAIFAWRSFTSTATNCYSSETIRIVGQEMVNDVLVDNTGVTITNCYAANGSWSDAIASVSLLENYNDEPVWVYANNVADDTPWLLKVFNPENTLAEFIQQVKQYVTTFYF